MLIEQLEPRKMLAANTILNVALSIYEVRLTSSPDDIGPGDLYVEISEQLGGGFHRSVVRRPDDNGELIFNPPESSPFQLGYQYSFDTNGPGGVDTVDIRMFDQDDLSDDDPINIGPRNGPPTILILRQDPFTGFFRFFNYPSGSANGLQGSDDYYRTNNLSYRTDTETVVLSSIKVASPERDGRVGAELFINVQTTITPIIPGATFGDTDRDGLLDVWEMGGGLPGADPLKKDVYVQVDAMHGLAPSPLPPIVGASNTSAIVITSPHHGLTTGTQVVISGVIGNTAANGTFTVTRLTQDTFSLDGSIANGTYTGGGIWALPIANPTGTSLDLVVDAFARAPVSNPNGQTGINLHIEYGNVALPRVSWSGDGDGDGVFPHGEDSNLNGILDGGEDTNSNGTLDDGDTDDWGGLSYYKAARDANFIGPTLRQLAYRYAVFADQIIDTRGFGKGSIGGTIGRAYSAFGFSVSLGSFPGVPLSDGTPTIGGFVDEQAAAFMHMLGHTLGLDHGGGDDIDFKPNYESVMNSLWTLPTSPLLPAADWRLDYSNDELRTLNESAIQETRGLGNQHASSITIGPGTSLLAASTRVAGSGPIDLNNNGRTDDILDRDLNSIRRNDPSPGQMLFGHRDWSNLQFEIGSEGLDGGLYEDFPNEERELAWEDVIEFESAFPARFSINDVTVTEGNTGELLAPFEVTLDRPTRAPASVRVAVNFAGTADANDLATVAGTLNFAPGVTSRTVFVPIKGDTVMEADETFAVLLSRASRNTLIHDNFGLGTIIDDDVQAIYTTPTGPLDVTWDFDGLVSTSVPVLNPDFSGGSGPSESRLDSNGRLVVIGSEILTGNDETGIKLVRYLPNGTLDPTFGANGIVNETLPEGRTFARGGAIYQSGPHRDKILVTGTNNIGGDQAAFVARYNLDGSLDTTFGPNSQGYIRSSDIAFTDGFDIAIYGSGPRAGQFLMLRNTLVRTAGVYATITRHNADGSLDASFGTDGIVIPDGTSNSTLINKMLIDANSKISLAGSARFPFRPSGESFVYRSAVLLRLNDDGTRDNAFGDGRVPGITFVDDTQAASGPIFGLKDIDLRSDGTIVGVTDGGETSNGIPPGPRLVRFTSNGVVDFVSSSLLTNDDAEDIDITVVGAVASDAQGRVYVGGYSSPLGVAGAGDFVVARFVPNGATLELDPTFNPGSPGGILVTPPYGLGIVGMNIAPDGGLLASGQELTTLENRLLFATNKYETTRNDLSVTMTSDTSRTSLDSTISYTIRIRNTGDAAVFPSLRMELPEKTVFASLATPVSWAKSTPAVNAAGTVVAAGRRLLESGGEQVFTLVVKLDGTQVLPQDIIAAVDVSSAVVDTDTLNNSTTISTTITEITGNRAPAFTSVPVLGGTQDIQYSYLVTTSDPDVGDTLTITAPTLPSWLTLTPTGNGTATLAGTPGNANVGSHDVELRVIDAAGAPATQSFTIVVANVSTGGVPPRLSFANVISPLENSNPLTAIKVADVVITDPDGGPNVLAFSGPDAAFFTLVGNQLFLKGGTILDFETKPTYVIDVTVDDATIPGSPDDTARFTMMVTDVNEPPVIQAFNIVTGVLESTILNNSFRVADLRIVDDALGTETITLSGPDAPFFELQGLQLHLKKGTELDYETKSSYRVTVSIDDPIIPGDPDSSVDLTLAVLDVFETPAAFVVVDGREVLSRGAISFGYTAVAATPPSRSFVVQNRGDANLLLQPIVVPNGFTLVTPNFAPGQVVLPGRQVAFIVAMNTATGGEVSGELSFRTNDGGKPLQRLQLAGAVVVPTNNPSRAGNASVVDDGDAGFYKIGAWAPVAGYGYDRDALVAPGNGGGQQAIWAVGNLTPGLYDVSLTWLPGSDRFDKAPFVIRDGVEGPILASGIVNQKVLPKGGPELGNRPFKVLDRVNLAGNALVVELSNEGAENHAVIADAVLIEPVMAPPAPEITVRRGGNEVIDGSQLVLPPVLLGSSGSHPIVVRNDGSADLILQPVVVTGPAFSVLGNFAPGTIVPSGAQQTFLLVVNATAAGVFNGTLSMNNNDSDEDPFDLRLTASVVPPRPPVSMIDDRDPGFSLTGNFDNVPGYGFAGNARAITKQFAGTATWTFTDLVPGEHELQVTWLFGNDRANKVSYVIRDGIGGPILGTVEVNQKKVPGRTLGKPSGPVYGGRPFQSLGRFAVTGTTLVVQLDNTGATGVVVADAMRLEALTPPPRLPEIRITDRGLDVVDGGSINLGSAERGGAPVRRTLTVENTGSGDLILEPLQLSGSGFSLVTSNFTPGQKLAPAAKMDMTVELGTATKGVFNGAISLPNNDGDENPYDIALRGLVNEPLPGGVRVIDNGDNGFFAALGFTPVHGNYGYGGNALAGNGSDGAETASWTFNGLGVGTTHNVAVTWLRGGDRDKATYVIRDGAAGAILGTVEVDQTKDPSGSKTEGRPFHSLGVFTTTTGTLQVEISTTGSTKAVIVDAARLTKV